MSCEYNNTEIDSWISGLVTKIDNGTLILKPSDTVLQLNRQCIDALANLLKFRRGIHTVEVSPQFAVNTSEWIAYLYRRLGTLVLKENNQNVFLRRLTLNQLQLTDYDIAALVRVAPEAKFKYVGLAGNQFTQQSFDKLVECVIANELETRFWVDDYRLNPATDMRIQKHVSELYNVAQIFSYLFSQKLPYDLYKTILIKLHTTLEEKDWLCHIKPNSKLAALLPPDRLDQTLAHLIDWIKLNSPECVQFVPIDEIKKIVLTEPQCLLSFKDQDGSEAVFKDFETHLKAKVKAEQKFNPQISLSVPKAPVTSINYTHTISSKPKTATVIDFNKYQHSRHK